AVGRAGEAGIVGTDRHLYCVQHSLVELAVMDQTLGGLRDRHIDGSVVVGGAHNHVDVGDQTVGIGGVVVDESAARRFGAANASRCPRRNLHPGFGAGNFGIVQQADGVFGVVEQFDQ